MWGIQVNVGYVTTPDWRWDHRGTMDRVEFPTEAAAQNQMKLWYPTAKSACFRVAKIED